MDLNELLKTLNEDLALNKHLLKQISDAIVEQQVSNYPVFVAFRNDELSIGKPVINKHEFDMNWHINVSHLEEFVNANIVHEAMVDHFKEIYKDPAEFMCWFLIYNEEGNFIFKPYKPEKREE